MSELQGAVLSDYVSQSDAEARLGISRTLFERSFRPKLTPLKFGARGARFAWSEIEALVAESAAQEEGAAAMFFRRTVKDALEHTWALTWSQAKAPRKKAQLVKVCKAEVGAQPLSKCDYAWLESWILQMRERDLAVATIKTKVSCVLYALRQAQRRGWIKEVPDPPEIGTGGAKLRYLKDEPDEEALLLAACENAFRRPIVADTMRHVIIFLVDTGARLGELIKLDASEITARGATFEDRKAADALTVPLTARARESADWLLESSFWRARVRGARRSEKRHQSAQNWVTHRFDDIRTAGGPEGITAHSLRHTFASRLVQAGVDIFTVSKLLGHASIRMTERYSHLAPSAGVGAIAILERRGVADNVVPFKGRDR